MASPRFKNTCNRCGVTGLGWRKADDDRWILIAKLKSGRSVPHICGAIGMPPVPGKEYLTEKLRDHIAFIQMDNMAGIDPLQEYLQAQEEYQEFAGPPAEIGDEYDWFQY